jgi:hypothetical protein
VGIHAFSHRENSDSMNIGAKYELDSSYANSGRNNRIS